MNFLYGMFFKHRRIFYAVYDKGRLFARTVNFSFECRDFSVLNLRPYCFPCFWEKCKVYLAVIVGEFCKCHISSFFCPERMKSVYKSKNGVCFSGVSHLPG